MEHYSIVTMHSRICATAPINALITPTWSFSLFVTSCKSKQLLIVNRPGPFSYCCRVCMCVLGGRGTGQGRTEVWTNRASAFE